MDQKQNPYDIRKFTREEEDRLREFFDLLYQINEREKIIPLDELSEEEAVIINNISK